MGPKYYPRRPALPTSVESSRIAASQIAAASILAASILAAGCCCPPVSGRYGDAGCCPPPRAARCCCPLCVATRQGSTAFCPPTSFPPADIPAQESHLTAADAANAPICIDSGPERSCCGRLHAWFAGWRHGVPSQQHPDYYSPPPKFHPIPTRPAFEPLPSYPPLLPADPGLNNPLRASTDRSLR